MDPEPQVTDRHLAEVAAAMAALALAPLDVSQVDPSSLLTLVGQPPDEEELLPVRQRRLDWAACPPPARHAPRPETEFDFIHVEPDGDQDVDDELGAHLIH